MKTSLTLLAAIVAASLLQPFVGNATANEVVRLSEPVASDAVSETFGALMPDTEESHRLPELLATAETVGEKPVLLRTEIAQVCQKKGCFFIARDGAAAIRVSFKDYGFFVPSNTAGREVLLYGVLTSREVTADQAEHFAEDLGSNTPVPAGPTWEFVASSVKIFL